MRSAKIVSMVTALSDNSKSTIFKRNSISTLPKNPSNNTSDLPSAELIAKEALSPDNPLNKVFEEIGNQYKLPTLSALPSTLGGSFDVLSKISNVLSKLPADQKSEVKAKLQDAFRDFYVNNLKLPTATAESSAAEMANALTNGPEAVHNLKNLVKEIPLAKQLGRDVMRSINSKVNNDAVLAKQTSDSGRTAQDLSLHQAA